LFSDDILFLFILPSSVKLLDEPTGIAEEDRKRYT